MWLLQRTKRTRSKGALCDVFEAFVQAKAADAASRIGFGVFNPSGTVVDRLLVKLPKTAVPLEPAVPQALTPASELAGSHDPDGPSP